LIASLIGNALTHKTKEDIEFQRELIAKLNPGQFSKSENGVV
jgi:hypothetical protein